MNYLDKLRKAVTDNKSVLCVGLDPNPDLIPEFILSKYKNEADLIEAFCREAIEATHQFCSAYKPNLAFFEALGSAGIAAFERVLAAIPDDKIVIADAKRGDIGSTAEQYKKAFFDRYDVDAITLNPLMGFETLDPFLTDPSKAAYVLVLTSNTGASDLLQRRFEGRSSLAEYIADQLRRKTESTSTHIGMVTGATQPEELDKILQAYPGASLLIPGIGTQGGKPDQLLPVIRKHKGISLVNSSRSILYGNSGPDWKKAITGRAKNLNLELQSLVTQYV